MKSMNITRKVLFVLFYFFIISSFYGCGYKPASQYAKQELNNTVFVKLFVDLKDPRNTVIVKDALNQILIQKLGKKLVDNESMADSVMKLKLNSVGMQELQYDKEGYNKLYKAVVSLGIEYKNQDNKLKYFTLSGEHNFSIDDGTTITDTKRFEAIKSAADDAMDDFLSKLAVESFRK
ncbi:MAG: LPS assembly lipoprotein LptE [Campylobacterota bacterium]